MLTLLATIVVLSVLILVHELGHLFAAKSVDMEVIRFSIGFGPKLFGFRKGETEYVVSALPLGGYVSVAGVAGEEAAAVLEGGEAAEREPSPRDFEAKSLIARAWFVSAGVLMNFVFAVLVFAGLSLAYGEPFDPTTRLDIIDPSQSPENAEALASIPRGAEVVAVDDEPVNSRTDLRDAVLAARAGNLVLHFAEAPPVTLEVPPGDAAREALADALHPLYEPVIGQVLPNTPAAEAGLEAGDRVLRAGGEPVQTWGELVQIIRSHAEQPLELEVERDGRELSLTATPIAQRGSDVVQLGIFVNIEFAREHLGVIESVREGAESTWFYSTMVGGFLSDLVTGDESPRNVGSILTIGEISGQAARLGLEAFLRFLGIFSVHLAVLNLLPIPILDGGHLLFLGIEAVRGRPLSVEQRLRLSHVGLIIVVGLMVWAMTNDVLRVFGV